ncbi:MAG: ABC transporter substrate-binding protein [Syntrophales bacterium]|nr:ABC transporter substrate-binding protein [Syntrophales bacterium]MDY0043708.1 ABC transporter substrate-binding protein [Syntrophales bacterium]
MKTFFRIWYLYFFVTILILNAPLYAATPHEAAEEYVNKVMEVLGNKELGKEAKQERLEQLYPTMFAERELSRRSLGRGWEKLNPSQQKEFVNLFRQVLEKAYIDKILSYTDEKIEFTGTRNLNEDQSEVQTRVVTSSGRVPIDYRMIKIDDKWQIYDVIIENVSLIRNYRSQFRSILARDTPEELLEILRKKVKEK